jgi:hypothetical protein
MKEKCPKCRGELLAYGVDPTQYGWCSHCSCYVIMSATSPVILADADLGAKIRAAVKAMRECK